MPILECTSHQPLPLTFCELCDPDSTVQGSRLHKWCQDVSCRYLMQRWQPLLELLLHHAPMVGPLRLCFPLGRSRRLPLVTWRFPLLRSRFAEDRVVLNSTSWQSGLSLFVLRHFFLLGMGHGFDMKWAGVAKSISPTHSIENKFVNIKVKCKCVLCNSNFLEEREGRKKTLKNMLFY